MDFRARYRLLVAAFALATPSALAAQTDSTPAEATAKAVADGKKLFEGAGLCLACHGVDAKGGIGPNLTDDQWLSGTGSFAEIVARIRRGVDVADSKSGQIMPPMGGASLSESQVKAVAAYVWTLSHRRSAPKPG